MDARLRLVTGSEAIQEPHWWHWISCLPGGNVIVQEEDWGSVIAFTLSSLVHPTGRHMPDADRGDSVWDEPEAYSTVVTHKERLRDPTALLSLPRERDSSSITVSRIADNAAPPSTWANWPSPRSSETSVAKLLGFNAVEVCNLDDGAVQAKADLLVMENSSYGQQPTEMFDLKDSARRYPGPPTPTTPSHTSQPGFPKRPSRGLRKRIMISLNEHYNGLLLYVCEDSGVQGEGTFGERRQKYAVILQSPHENQDQFVSAWDSYLMACPDRWTNPVDEEKLIHDPAHSSTVGFFDTIHFYHT
ncbi:hypothetical protein BGY98DRAFT_1123422 [Russula aff. rugulosa BPL654]|nr:hypothetical protein BGY98DRAFT_1123422 [Russula aff. rugulosa BPL654]